MYGDFDNIGRAAFKVVREAGYCGESKEVVIGTIESLFGHVYFWASDDWWELLDEEYDRGVADRAEVEEARA